MKTYPYPFSNFTNVIKSFFFAGLLVFTASCDSTKKTSEATATIDLQKQIADTDHQLEIAAYQTTTEVVSINLTA